MKLFTVIHNTEEFRKANPQLFPPQLEVAYRETSASQMSKLLLNPNTMTLYLEKSVQLRNGKLVPGHIQATVVGDMIGIEQDLACDQSLTMNLRNHQGMLQSTNLLYNDPVTGQDATHPVWPIEFIDAMQEIWKFLSQATFTPVGSNAIVKNTRYVIQISLRDIKSSMDAQGIFVDKDMATYFKKNFAVVKKYFDKELYVLCDGFVQHGDWKVEQQKATNCVTGVSLGIGLEILDQPNPSKQMLFRGVASVVEGEPKANELMKLAGLDYMLEPRHTQPKVRWSTTDKLYLQWRDNKVQIR